ncbi:MAG: hypothetical protein JWN70_4511 [Planctomycetaceae bacterium]|nr:hypothetical protein [Planctomycetaceae bacterium]
MHRQILPVRQVRSLQAVELTSAVWRDEAFAGPESQFMKRTALVPDGEGWWCHVCGKRSIIEPSFFGDATCAKCGSLLWPRPPRDRQAQLVHDQLRDAGARFAIDTDSEAWRIDLSSCRANDRQLAELVALEPITELILTDCPVTDLGVQSLVLLPTLEVLNLTHTHISDDGLRAVGSLSQLEVLSLNETGITDSSLNLLDNLRNLWCLDLDDTQVTGASFPQLHLLNQLEMLFVAHTSINDRALSKLTAASRLEEVWIHDTLVSAEGIAWFRRSRPSCLVHLSADY